jgi:hypothetical protein
VELLLYPTKFSQLQCQLGRSISHLQGAFGSWLKAAASMALRKILWTLMSFV